MQESAENALGIVAIVVLQVVGAVDGIVRLRRGREQLARVHDEIGAEARVDVEQDVRPPLISSGNGNLFAPAADIENGCHRAGD